jgi:hypothetical protein
VAALVVGALGRAHAGGHDNVRLPAFALLCVAAAAPLCRAALAPSAAPLRRLLMCGALLLQFALLWQAPAFHAPSARGERAFRELNAALVRCAGGGRAVALDYALLTGTPFLHTMALSDLRLGDSAELARAGTSALLGALSAADAPAAIAVGERFAELDRALAAGYVPCAELPAPAPPTGYTPGDRTAAGRVQRVYARTAASAR